MSNREKKFRISACGGTFDLFHKGHKKFLDYIFSSSERVVIGLASDEFSSQKKLYENFLTRKKTLERYLYENKYDGEIVTINDTYGPTTSNKYKLDALFVTDDSMNGADLVNKKREKLGIEKLKIVKVELEKSTDGKIISSSRIKNGEIDREGNLYIDDNLLNYDYLLPNNLRKKLSEPFGQLITDFDIWLKSQSIDSSKIITVGDAVTAKFLSFGITPRLSVIDLIINRKKVYKDIYELGFDKKIKSRVTVNPAGHIQSSLFKAIKLSIKDSTRVVLVDGEDDLGVIPVVLAAPLGFVVFYGQPGKGVVKIIVTEKIKNEIRTLISKFERKVI